MLAKILFVLVIISGLAPRMLSRPDQHEPQRRRNIEGGRASNS